MDLTLHFLHLASACLWVGGQMFLGLVLGPVLRGRLPPRERLPLVLSVGRRFQALSHAALAILLITGLWRIRYIFFTGAASFFSTAYGAVFGVKMALFALSLALSVLHNRRWGPEVQRWADRPESPEFRRASRALGFWARLQLLAVLGVVFAAAALRQNPF